MARLSTRDRILDAASLLFYREGIRAVSLDVIAAKAGVTKKTLYYHFRSKDDLIVGYLTSRDQPNLTLFAKWYDEAKGGAANRTAEIFRQVGRHARHPRWKGCGFLRTVAELANMPGHPARRIGAAHKKKFEEWLAQRYAESGLANPNTIARAVALLMEGAFAAMLIHRDPAYADAAAEAARLLVMKHK
jgi:AcrR family transcriptional regulator